MVDDEFQAQRVLDAVKEVAEPLVEEVRVFDHYTGRPIPAGRRVSPTRSRIEPRIERSLTTRSTPCTSSWSHDWSGNYLWRCAGE
jgi:phenylalanyl-tRNA synthetase beta subunit